MIHSNTDSISSFQLPAPHPHLTYSIHVSFPSDSLHSTEQLRFQDEFPLLVLLRLFIRLVVLPAHCVLALPTFDIPYHVPPCRHIPLCGLFLDHVDDGVEKIGFAVLPAEMLERKGG